ncbi:MAG: pyridoxamine 5-phosphate oxidase family protein [Glaciihabitans sp.]|jgi:nitroimidazol reductase NimA-like FMN-containing flavoprotein (pyridoxamine 5'-phosphate oxidase superfamily)|nr:pyridoxamine 5-phosphate oxidase family protein [Glaciihabitans sp.]
MTGNSSFDGWSPQGPVEELSDAACWALLSSSSMGRLALSVDNQPHIFPVDYFCDDDSIIFRTAAGTKLDDIAHNSIVAFEVDGRSTTANWSVVANGIAVVVRDEAEIAAADRGALPAWIPTAPYVYVRIQPTYVRGRRFTHSLFSSSAHS